MVNTPGVVAWGMRFIETLKLLTEQRQQLDDLDAVELRGRIAREEGRRRP